MCLSFPFGNPLVAALISLTRGKISHEEHDVSPRPWLHDHPLPPRPLCRRRCLPFHQLLPPWHRQLPPPWHRLLPFLLPLPLPVPFQAFPPLPSAMEVAEEASAP